jgi:hypothetical protein
MEVLHWKECEDKKIAQFLPGKCIDVDRYERCAGFQSLEMTTHGYPEYGLRFFTINRAAKFLFTTTSIIEPCSSCQWEFECWEFNSETDELKGKATCGPGSSIYIPSMQPHGMRNVSDGPGTFLCCICNVYDAEEIV